MINYYLFLLYYIKKFDKIKKVIIFINLLLFIFILNLDNIKKENKIKVCLCTIGKLENKYIVEFVEYYKNYNIDKIFIYDNNDINGEKFEDILSDYMKLNFIEIIHHRGEKKIQYKMYQDCYRKNNKLYDWLIFYDIDEYIHLQNYHNIKDFLIQKKFNKCQSIYLNWMIHTDNNLKYYDNRSLYTRFTENYKNEKFCIGKTIIRGRIENLKIISLHLLDKNIGRCNGFGKIIKIKKKTTSCEVPDYKYFYIDHFYSKSTEEFINKINKGDAAYYQNIQNKYIRIKFYFRFNKITKEKMNFIIKKTNLNFSILMNKLKNIKII